MQQRPTRVFVVDDHTVVRGGLHAYLEVVAMTSFAQADLVQGALQAGESDVLRRIGEDHVYPTVRAAVQAAPEPPGRCEGGASCR
jgi:hypothetical protein